MDLMESLSFELRHFSMLGVFTYRDQPTSKFLAILFPLLFYPSIIIELITFTDVDNLDDLTEIAYEFAIHQVSVVKLRCLIANADELRRIFDGFKSTIFHPYGPKYDPLLKKAMRHVSLSSKVLFTPTAFTVLFMLVLPLFQRSGKLPIVWWSPLDLHTPIGYGISFIIQFIFIAFLGTTTVELDVTIAALLHFAETKMKILELELQLMCDPKRTCRQKLGAIKTASIFHIECEKLISDIARMFNAGLTIKCVVYGVTACALAYRGLMANVELINAIGATGVLIIMLSQLLYLCHYGNQISVRSACLLTAAYKCQWHLLNTKCCHYKPIVSSLLIFREGLKKPRVIIVGKLFEICYDTFGKVVKFGFQAFAVVKDVVN